MSFGAENARSHTSQKDPITTLKPLFERVKEELEAMPEIDLKQVQLPC